jgi:hypothetical protein
VATDSLPDGPYADAWKKFEKIQNAAEGRRVAWLGWLLAVLAPLITAFPRASIARRFELEYWLFLCVLGGVGLLWSQYWMRQIKRWRCPRCHSEWPGVSSVKAPHCVACGLHLYQTAP